MIFTKLQNQEISFSVRKRVTQHSFSSLNVFKCLLCYWVKLPSVDVVAVLKTSFEHGIEPVSSILLLMFTFKQLS